MAKQVNIDYSKAEEIILKAYRTECIKGDEITDGIAKVLTGSHKTYKYILTTGLLAKASNHLANPIALQAGAPVKGAYDARSLCHRVLVPFERDFLDNVLGGSNEPFLNKPARFTHLSKDNAVRRGQDKETLLLVINILQSIKVASEAQAYLACAFSTLRTQIEARKNEFSEVTHYSPTLIEIYDFSLRFLKNSFEGETSVIIVGALETLFYRYVEGNYKVVVHKVNQSGASSNEVGDIDIYRGDIFECAIEVKDKIFTEHDIAHAFNKIIQAKGHKAAFIYGPRASIKDEAVFKRIKLFEEQGLCIIFEKITKHIRNILFRLPPCTKEDFINCLIMTSKQMNCKEETKNWMLQVFSDLHWDSLKLVRD